MNRKIVCLVRTEEKELLSWLELKEKIVVLARVEEAELLSWLELKRKNCCLGLIWRERIVVSAWVEEQGWLCWVELKRRNVVLAWAEKKDCCGGQWCVCWQDGTETARDRNAQRRADQHFENLGTQEAM